MSLQRIQALVPQGWQLTWEDDPITHEFLICGYKDGQMIFTLSVGQDARCHTDEDVDTDLGLMQHIEMSIIRMIENADARGRNILPRD